ncbi:MAG: hypothetical protein AAF804_08545 [Bacteroidota bacterium]
MVTHQFSLRLDVIIFREGEQVIAFAPALDISGYADTEGEALTSLNAALEEFLTFGVENDTLIDELERLGWTKEADKPHPPQLSHLISTQDYVSEIIDQKEFSRTGTRVNIPVVA